MRAKVLQKKLKKNVEDKRKKDAVKKSFRIEIIAKHKYKNTKCTNHHESDIYYAKAGKR